MQKSNLELKALLVFVFYLTALYSLLFSYDRELDNKSLKSIARQYKCFQTFCKHKQDVCFACHPVGEVYQPEFCVSR